MATQAPVQHSVNIAEIPIENRNQLDSVYSNNIMLSTGPWDLRLTFTEVMPEGQRLTQVLRANVVISVAQGKALLDALQKVINSHEQMHGETAWPRKNQDLQKR